MFQHFSDPQYRRRYIFNVQKCSQNKSTDNWILKFASIKKVWLTHISFTQFPNNA